MSRKLSTSENKKLQNKLHEIATILLNNAESSKENISLIGGKTGIAIFFYYYSKYMNDEKYADHGFKLLTEVFEEINNGFSFHTFAGGIAGIGWAIEHLAHHGYIDKEITSVLDDLDDYLFNCMMRDIKKGNYDFLHGAVGIGLYFLSRTNQEKANNYLELFIDELDKLGEEDKVTGAIKWLSVIDHENGTKGYNISLSHGISSIIVFLSKIYDSKIQAQKTLKLLNGAVTYLLEQQLNTNKYTSSFPNVAIESKEPVNSRLAWCYGDLGIGMALWQASQSTNNIAWEKKTIEVLLYSTKRKDIKEAMAVDAGLCHGAAGIAHIYNRIYLNTVIKDFKQPANYWFNETLKMATHIDAYAGYRAWHTEKHGGWINNAGLLEGVAGIGLALISSVSDIKPNWDECLLLN